MSTAGEVIAALGGVAICAPLLYQSQSLIVHPSRSPLNGKHWNAWAIGFLGLAAYFGHSPSNETPNNSNSSEPEYVPLAPRSLGLIGLVACGLCELCWALDRVGPSLRGRERAVAVTKSLAAVIVYIALYFGLGLLHNVVRAKTFYWTALTIIAFACGGCSLGNAVFAVLAQTPLQLRRGGGEVAGLYWIPAAMQALGYFTCIMACVLIYTSVDWYGTGLLAMHLAGCIVYIVFSRLRALQARGQGQYSLTAGDEADVGEAPR